MTQAWERAAFTALSDSDRGFCRLLLLTTLRRLGQIDAILAMFLRKPIPMKNRMAQQALRLGAAQLLFLNTPPHAAVNETVALAGQLRLKPLQGMLNAVLRRVAAEGPGLRDAQDAVRLNMPDWLWESWAAQYGEAQTRIMAALHLEPPPLDITLKNPAEAAAWAEKLNARPLPDGSLRLHEVGDVTRLAGYAEGAWWVQDAAAALPARMLGDVRGRRILDCCAAPGGKTVQLAAAGARVTAIDSSEKRLVRLRENLARLELTQQVEVICDDLVNWSPKEPYDGILLDAPCSATGTIRRHPDILHIRQPEEVRELAGIQRKMLARAREWVKPGGRIVYCVCSLQPEEVPAIPPGAALRRILPGEIEGGNDGFAIMDIPT